MVFFSSGCDITGYFGVGMHYITMVRSVGILAMSPLHCFIIVFLVDLSVSMMMH